MANHVPAFNMCEVMRTEFTEHKILFDGKTAVNIVQAADSFHSLSLLALLLRLNPAVIPHTSCLTPTRPACAYNPR